jgi:hypothetical protein
MQADVQSQQITLGTRSRPKRAASETPEARERRLAAARSYAAANRERIAAYKREWCQANPAKLIDYQRRSYDQNGAEIRSRANAWRLANIERKRLSNKAWADANADKALESSRQSKRRKRQDASFRLCKSVSELMRVSLRGDKDGASWETLVGYTRAALVNHIERQFVDGMSWSNYGQWHIDHIIPQSSFRFRDQHDPEFIACWALSNLRPLWATDNIRKRDRRLHLI